MLMFKKWGSVLGVGVLALTVLAACGGETGGGTDGGEVEGDAVTRVTDVANAPVVATPDEAKAAPDVPPASPAEGAASPVASPAAGAAASPAASPVANGAASPAAGGTTGGATGGVTLVGVDIAWEYEGQRSAPGNPVIVTVAPGTTITLPNEGASPHNFIVEALGIDVDMPVGETVEATIPADTAPGEYAFICNVPGHAALMFGTLIVQ